MPRKVRPSSPAGPSTANRDNRYPVQCASVAATLGKIRQLLLDKQTKTLDKSVFTGHTANYVCTLPDGTLYFWTDDMDVDDDGYTSKDGLVLINKPPDWAPDEDHQPQTSLPGLSAFVDPYVVLPFDPTNWYLNNTECRIGDGAVVIAGNGEFTLAVFGDEGPGTKIGEMSLAAHAKFVGWGQLFTTGVAHPLPGSATREQRPQTGPMITMVFPGTRGRSEDPYDLASALEQARLRFWSLSGDKKPPL